MCVLAHICPIVPAFFTWIGVLCKILLPNDVVMLKIGMVFYIRLCLICKIRIGICWKEHYAPTFAAL
jgi:hypothetical protein